jgi:transposase
MIGFGSATRVYLAAGATDMRKGFDGLYGMVRDRLRIDPLSGHLFVFCNGRRNRLKVLYWDGSGLWLCSKRLEKGRFSWPAQGDDQGRVRMSSEELTLLVGGDRVKPIAREGTVPERNGGKAKKKLVTNTGFLLVMTWV